jgi:uncharacterized delta-60 repeat protein
MSCADLGPMTGMMTVARRIVPAAVMLLGLAGSAGAAAYDPTFGGTGIVHDPIVNGRFSGVTSMVLQPDGRIVGVGVTGPSVVFAAGSEMLLVRVLSDGTFDPDFGVAGRVTTALGAGAWGQAVALQSDGKIVVGGRTDPNSGSSHYVVARYADDGSLDPSFGTGGVTVLASPIGLLGALLIDPIGRIVVAGSAGTDAMIARFDGNGVLDATFGVGGTSSIPNAFASALVREPDGHLVVAGWASNGTDDDVWLARVDDAGALDPSFGTAGIATAPVSTTDDRAFDLVRQPDGRLVVAGGTSESPPNGVSRHFLVRFGDDGALDATFGTAGVALGANSLGQISFAGVALTDDGEIVAAGTWLDDTFGDFTTSTVVRRYLADGTLDPTLTVPFDPATDSFVTDVALQPDGRILVGGIFVPFDSQNPAPAPYGLVEVRRFVDDGFCGDGMVGTGEQCDAPGPCCVSCHVATGAACASDGNACTSDVCDATATCTHPPVSDGILCDDANLCTSADRCQAGTCVGELVAPDQFCAECDPVLGTVVRPRAGCKHTTTPGAASLKLRRGTTPANDRLTWKWKKGDATSFAELGDPFTSSPTNGLHELCVFDVSGPEPVLMVATGAEPETFELCARPPCWRTRGSSLVYKSNPPNLFGVTSLSLAAGAAGRTKNGVKAKGASLFTPNIVYAPVPPPWTTPLRVQLNARDGACFEATFSAAGLRANGTTTFSAKSD